MVMRLFLLVSLLVLFAPAPAAAAVVIADVVPNPALPEPAAEFVVVANTGDAAVLLDGMRLTDATGAVRGVVPVDTGLLARGVGGVVPVRVGALADARVPRERLLELLVGDGSRRRDHGGLDLAEGVVGPAGQHPVGPLGRVEAGEQQPAGVLVGRAVEAWDVHAVPSRMTSASISP